MKKRGVFHFIAVLSVLLTAETAFSHREKPFTHHHFKGKEVLFRATPQFGVLGKMKINVLNSVLKRFVQAAPAGTFDFQFAEHWYITSTFTYAYFRGKTFNALRGDGRLFAPTLGFKISSTTVEPSTGEFVDDSRWWVDLQFGPYFTQLNTSIPGNRNATNLGFNLGIGFDYMFARHWGAGAQVKVHYSKFPLDDYFLITFGPSLITRF